MKTNKGIDDIIQNDYDPKTDIKKLTVDCKYLDKKIDDLKITYLESKLLMINDIEELKKQSNQYRIAIIIETIILFGLLTALLAERGL